MRGERGARPFSSVVFPREQAGTTAVEFALIAPVFLLCLFGVIQFGWAFFCGSSVSSAVQKETRLLIANPSTTADQFKSAVLADLKSLVQANITITLSSDTLASGAQVTRISWTYGHQVLFPFAPQVMLSFGSSTLVPKPLP